MSSLLRSRAKPISGLPDGTSIRPGDIFLVVRGYCGFNRCVYARVSTTAESDYRREIGGEASRFTH